MNKQIEIIIGKEPTNKCPYCDYEGNVDYTLTSCGEMGTDIALEYNCSRCGKKYHDIFSFQRTIVFESEKEIEEIQQKVEGYTFPCSLHESPRTLGWCKKNCLRHYSCKILAKANEDSKEIFKE